MLRTADLLDLRKSSISFCPGRAALSLCGKTGNRTGSIESAVLDDAVALKLLRLICRSKTGPQHLLAMSSCKFRQVWRWAILQLKLDAGKYQPYGIRRGGAVEDFQTYGDAGRLCIRGRWGSIRTAKLYAEEGLRVRQMEALEPESANLIKFWSAEFAKRLKAV